MSTTEPETFLVKLGDLSETIRERIKAETRHYTVPLVINDIPLGSGTLVEIDGHFAILTAEHVVRHPERPDLHLDNMKHGGPKLLIPPLDFPADISFESYALRVFTTGRKNSEYGPDLAIVVLPPSGKLQEIQARRSFYPLASKTEEKKAQALEDVGFMAFCGFPGATRLEHEAALGFSKVVELGGFAFITGRERYEEREPWDYFELGVKGDEVVDIGHSFGGVSGGGVWQVPVYRKKGDPEGSEYYKRMTFAGVAFCEEEHRPEEDFFVRTHGPKSIYERFLPSLREKLKE